MKKFHGFGRGRHLPWAGTVLLLLLTLLAGRGFAAAPKQEARRIAIVIGAGQFPGAKGTLSPLRWSAYDAVRVASVFLDPRLGAFNKVYLLVSASSLQAVALDTTPLADEPLLQSEFGGIADAAQALLEAPPDQVERREPTTGALKTLLKDLQGNMQEGELLALYVAGHGAIEGESYAGTYLPHERMRLILEDAVGDSNQKGGRSFRNTLSLAELLMALSKVPARRKVLIQDVCHSGLPGYTFRGTPNDSTQGWQSRAYRTTVLTSSGPAQSSIELDSLKGGLFTHALIRVLQAPINEDRTYQDSEVTVEDVWEATRTWMKTWFQCHPALYGSTQTPGFFDAEVGEKVPLLLSGQSPVSARYTLPIEPLTLEEARCQSLGSPLVATRRDVTTGEEVIRASGPSSWRTPTLHLTGPSSLTAGTLEHLWKPWRVSVAPGLSHWQTLGPQTPSPTSPEFTLSSLELTWRPALATTPRAYWTLEGVSSLRLLGGWTEQASSEERTWMRTSEGVEGVVGLAWRQRLRWGDVWRPTQLSLGAGLGGSWLEFPLPVPLAEPASTARSLTSEAVTYALVPVRSLAAVVEGRVALSWVPRLQLEGIPWLSAAWHGLRPARWSLEALGQLSYRHFEGSLSLTGQTVTAEVPSSWWGMAGVQAGWEQHF